MTPKQQLIVRRAQAVEEARESLLAYIRLLHPDPNDPADPAKTTYVTAKHHQMIADHLEALERGEFSNLMISMPPRHGKTELATRGFPPWYVGRNRGDSIIVGTYGDDFANDLGREIRDNIENPATRQVFPKLRLKSGARAGQRQAIVGGGLLTAVGRGTAVTGRGGDLLILDDPLKDRVEADSATIRNKLWTWFTQVFTTRMMTDKAKRLIIQTRWHEDDLIGRLTDPRNPCYSRQEARKWKVLDLPALARQNDPLGRKEGQPLWPERFSRKYLLDMQGLDPRGFSALYQGQPSPEEGAYFQAHELVQYAPKDLPPNERMRFYLASDHAVSTAQDADNTVVMVVGVDEYHTLWVMPELVHGRIPSDKQVELVLDLVAKYKPLSWFAERGQIEKAIGPFLRKRMVERETFVSQQLITPAADKPTRAQSIKGRMAMGYVRFPAFAPWWATAKHQLLTFPYGANDDFVDTLSLVGLGLLSLVGGNKPRPKIQTAGPAFGTADWVRAHAKREDARRNTPRARGW